MVVKAYMQARLTKRHLLAMLASAPVAACGGGGGGGYDVAVFEPPPASPPSTPPNNAGNGRMIPVSTPPLIEWRGVCWSPELGIYVAVAQDEGDGPAVGHNGLVMTSPDGKDWTVRQAAAQLRWQDVCWSAEAGVFVAVAQDGNEHNAVMVSRNGIDWQNTSIPRSNGWRTVTWSRDLRRFVALAQTGDEYRAMTSPDGIRWTAFQCPLGRWRSVVWAPALGKFIAVGEKRLDGSEPIPDYHVMTSADGETWQGQYGPERGWQDIAWSEELGLAVAVCEYTSDRRVMTSRDGVYWSLEDHVTDTSFRTVEWSRELGFFLAAGNNADTQGGETAAMMSYDGIRWYPVNTARGLSLGKCAYAPAFTRFACVGQTGDSRVQIGPVHG